MFAQFLDKSGIHMQPAVFIAIIIGGFLFLITLVVTVIYVHRRSKRQIAEGAFDKSAFSVVSLTHPRPPLPIYQLSPRTVLQDREAQKHDLVAREVRQQEANYMQLMRDIQRPASRAGTTTLPDQTPRLPYHPPRVVNRDPAQAAPPRSPLTAYPAVENHDHVQIAVPGSPLTAYPVLGNREPTHVALPISAFTAYPLVATPPPVAVLDAVPTNAAQLQRGLSVLSLESTASEYSMASAVRDEQQERYQPFHLGLPPIPASPSTPLTPKWPSSPGSYVWPKRQRASQIRQELAPDTYAKVRWITDDESSEPAAAIPVAHAIPPSSALEETSSVSHMRPPRINVPPPVAQSRTSSDSTTTSSSTVLRYYAAASGTRSPTPTMPDFSFAIPPRPQPQTPQRPF
ncbi:hypothetical protein B0H15DRAFT_954195 [Mycena belliarum]|uniref:Uncharacterized protein n=1 Tax=Mycena belliarum TaxID=1033014 RepID=A0AAD6TYT5_9AGAR|nr:hypothetical protein B0H15DRAFT_954195 [Mycena belliae]